MEELVLKLLEQSPVAGAVIFVTWLFLRNQTKRDKEWTETVRHIDDRANACHRDCTNAVKENSQVLHKVAGLIETRIRQEGTEL